MFNNHLSLFIVYAIKCIWTRLSCVRSNLNLCNEFLVFVLLRLLSLLRRSTHTHTCNADKEKKRNLDSRYSKGNIDRSSLFSSSVRCFIRYSTVCLCVFFFCVCSICGSHSLTFLSLFIIVCAILLTMPLMCCCFYVHVMFARFFCFRE